MFGYLDSHTLGAQFTAAQFWERALLAFEWLVKTEPDKPLAQQYHLCRENGFGPFTLEALFRLLKKENRRLILLLDEFDVLLSHPILNSAEFFGSLRSLASRSESLALVAGSSRPLAYLNAQTQVFNPTGSPYFNIFTEITLGPFPKGDIETLLNRAGERFTLWDRRAIRLIAGGHPFLLQAAAAAMWEAHQEGLTEIGARRRYVGRQLYRENRSLFADTWRVWTPAFRKAFASVGLAHTAHLLPRRDFLTDAFVAGMRDFGPELADLEAAGWVPRDEPGRGGWRVGPQAMLWWLADELVQAVRADTSFDDWLRAQELDHLLTPRERERLNQVTRGAVQSLQQGAVTLVEAFAQGLGAGLAGGE